MNTIVNKGKGGKVSGGGSIPAGGGGKGSQFNTPVVKKGSK